MLFLSPVRFAFLFGFSGCAVISDDQLSLWRDPDRDGVFVDQDCDNQNAEIGDCSETDETTDTRELWNNTAGVSGEDPTYELVLGDYYGLAHRISVVDGGAGVLASPGGEGTKETTPIVWVSEEGGLLALNGMWVTESAQGPLSLAMPAHGASPGREQVVAGYPQAAGEQGRIFIGDAAKSVTPNVLSGDVVGSSGARLGMAVALDTLQVDNNDEQVVIVGAPGESRVYIYPLDDLGGDPIAILEEPGAPDFGHSVRIIETPDNGAYLIVGSPEDAGGAGRLYIYPWWSDNDFNAKHPAIVLEGGPQQRLGTAVYEYRGDSDEQWLAVETAHGVRMFLLDTRDLTKPGAVQYVRDLGGHLIAINNTPWETGAILSALGATDGPDGAAWIAVAGSAVDSDWCPGEEAGVFLYALPLPEGSVKKTLENVYIWTPDDARAAVCYDDDLDFGISTAIIGVTAAEQHLLVTRPASNNGGFRLQLFANLQDIP